MLTTSFGFRLVKLIFGLFLYGAGLALMVHAGIGLAPYDVLAQGISIQTGLSFGWATVTVSAFVLLLWIPLRVKPGLGSVLNAILVGLFADVWLSWLPEVDNIIANYAVFILGLLVIAFATGLYISCGMGKGPRDGLHVGTAQKLKKPFWQVRTGYELIVLLAGFALGGQIGMGTLIFAASIGYLNQLSMRLFGLADRTGRV